MSRLAPTLALIALLPQLAAIAGKRRESSYIGFHLESSEADRVRDTRKILIGTKDFRVRVSPEFGRADIAGFYPFRAEGGASFGTAFKLNKDAAGKLQALSEAARGKRIFTVLNTNAIDFVVIDRPIDDGYIVCWKGLTAKHLEQIKASGIPQIQPAAPAPEPGRAPADDFAPLPGDAPRR